MLRNSLLACFGLTQGAELNFELRSDGIPVKLLSPEEMKAQRASMGGGPQYPFNKFSEPYVKKALSVNVDWREMDIVTPVKDQGPHGCVFASFLQK